MEKLKLNMKCVEIKTVTTETEESEREQIKTTFAEVTKKDIEKTPQKISITGDNLKIGVGEEIQFEISSPQKKLAE